MKRILTFFLVVSLLASLMVFPASAYKSDRVATAAYGTPVVDSSKPMDPLWDYVSPMKLSMPAFWETDPTIEVKLLYDADRLYIQWYFPVKEFAKTDVGCEFRISDKELPDSAEAPTLRIDFAGIYDNSGWCELGVRANSPGFAFADGDWLTAEYADPKEVGQYFVTSFKWSDFAGDGFTAADGTKLYLGIMANADYNKDGGTKKFGGSSCFAEYETQNYLYGNGTKYLGVLQLGPSPVITPNEGRRTVTAGYGSPKIANGQPMDALWSRVDPITLDKESFFGVDSEQIRLKLLYDADRLYLQWGFPKAIEDASLASMGCEFRISDRQLLWTKDGDPESRTMRIDFANSCLADNSNIKSDNFLWAWHTDDATGEVYFDCSILWKDCTADNFAALKGRQLYLEVLANCNFNKDGSMEKYGGCWACTSVEVNDPYYYHGHGTNCFGTLTLGGAPAPVRFDAPDMGNEGFAGIDGGYFAETADGGKTAGALAFTAYMEGLTALSGVTQIGMYVYRTGNRDGAVSLVKPEDVSVSDYVSAVIDDISPDHFGDDIYAIAYIVADGQLYESAPMNACVDDFITNWLGAQADN